MTSTNPDRSKAEERVALQRLEGTHQQDETGCCTADGEQYPCELLTGVRRRAERAGISIQAGDDRPDTPGEPQVVLNLRTLNGRLDIDGQGAVSMLISDGDSTVALRPGPLDGSSAAWAGAHILTTVAGLLRWELLRPPPTSPGQTSPTATDPAVTP